MQISDYDNNMDYLRSRLVSCIFRETMNNDFILIQNILGPNVHDSIATGFTMVNSTVVNLEVPIQYIDLNPFPIGNVNYRNTSMYVVRIPNRTYKQGLWGENIYCERGYIPPDSPEIFTTLRGKYPSLYKAIDSLYSNESSLVSISRDLSISGADMLKDGSGCVESTLLLRSDLPVGSLKFRVEDSFVSVQLLEKYSYLTEYVEEEMKGVSAC